MKQDPNISLLLNTFNYLSDSPQSFGFFQSKVQQSKVSEFYCKLRSLNLREKLYVFPQRVNRYNYFHRLESGYSGLKDLRKFYFDENRIRISQSTSEHEILNLININLRLGDEQLDLNWLNSLDFKNIKCSVAKWLRFYVICADINKQISDGVKIDLSHLLLLGDDLDESEDANLKIEIAIRYLVTHIRHIGYDQHLLKFSKIILKYLANETNNLYSVTLKSKAYRALPMLSKTLQEQINYLNKSLEITDKFKANSDLEQLVLDENKFNIILSKAKTYLHHKGYSNFAKNELIKLIELDPLDSAGYTELGLFHLSMDKKDLALKNLLRALELGPPGEAINAYYIGVLYDDLGNNTKAIAYYQLSAEIDPYSISPLLKMISHSEQNNNNRIKIIDKIYSEPSLKEQLTDDENTYLSKFLS